MTNPSQPATRKRITIIASSEGVEKAKKALIRLGFNNISNFAKSKLLARSTVTKFFDCQPIQLDTFKKICQELTLDWRVIAGITEEEPSKSLAIGDRLVSKSMEGGETVQTAKRQLTVTDQQTRQIKAVIVLEGDIDSEPNFKVLASILREYSGSSINIIDVQEGSIRLIVEGPREDIERLVSQFRSGEIKGLDNFPVEDIQILDEGSDTENKRIDDKWNLVRQIVSQGAKGRDLSGSDLSDADLSRADLSWANLSDANLGGANLSRADLSQADMRGAILSRADLSGADLSGADLSEAILSGADLSGADLSEAILSGADLSGADLSGAILSRVILSEADLSEANLREANLSGASLIGASLIGAILIWADLSGAILIEANLSGANVSFARFGYNQGISESMKLDLIKRGAIFADSPGDRSGILP